MKRLNINEIVIDDTYYAACCGNITEIIFKSVTQPKIIVYHLNIDYTFDKFLEDIGIEYSNEKYINDLNRVFKNKTDAENWITSQKYQKRLKEHKSRCKDLY